MQKPSLIIATGYHSLFAYLLTPYGDPELVKRIEFACDGQTDCPLLRWDDKRLCYVELAGMMKQILNRYKCESWGLGCRSEQVDAIKAEFHGSDLLALAAVMETDCEPINLANVEARFAEATGAGHRCALAS